MRGFFLLFFLLWSFIANAQQPTIQGDSSLKLLKTPQVIKVSKVDTNSLAYFLRKGSFTGFSRIFLMSTINEGNLKDFHTLGATIGGHYETAVWKGFKLGFTGSFIFNLLGSDLSSFDSITRKANRYEIGMYDILDPQRRWDLGKLEEAFLQYQHKGFQVKLGRQLLNTPFVNPEDGRLRPTFEEGLWADWKVWKYLRLQGGYLWRISPRSTTRWFNIGESIGLYPEGRNPDGKPSGYGGNSKSSGIVLGSLHFERANQAKGCSIRIQLWEQLVTNIFNTVLLQADWSKQLNKNDLRLNIGVQGIQQMAVGQGGNAIDSMRYFPLGQQTWVLGGQLGLQQKKWSLDLNYTQIFGGARFLMPREWGKEPLYTFIPRERNEGAGNSHALSINLQYQWPKYGFKARISYGHYLLPDVKEALLNKYAMPSYGHAQVLLEKNFRKKLENLQLRLLYMYKLAAANTYDNPVFVYNKVNMHHLNLIIDYKF